MIELDFRQRVLLSMLLDARGEFAHLMDATLVPALDRIAERLEAAGDSQLSLTGEEQRALIAVADAAWNHHNTIHSSPPFTLFNDVGGLEDKDFFELLALLSGKSSVVPQPILFRLLQMMAYIKEIHYTIDPLMFDIKENDFATLKDVLTAGILSDKPGVSYPGRLGVENLVSAAWEYSYRNKGNGLPGIQNPEFDQVLKWLTVNLA